LLLTESCDNSRNSSKKIIARIILCGFFLKSSPRCKHCLLQNIWSLIIMLSNSSSSGNSISGFEIVCSSLSDTIRCILAVARYDDIGILLGKVLAELAKDKSSSTSSSSSVCPYIVEKLLMRIPWEQMRTSKGNEAKMLIDQTLRVLGRKVSEPPPRSSDISTSLGHYLAALAGAARLSNAEVDCSSIVLQRMVVLGKFLSTSISMGGDSPLMLQRLTMVTHVLSSVCPHVIEHLAPEKCLEILVVCSALSSTCQYLSDKRGVQLGSSQSSLVTKKRKYEDEEGGGDGIDLERTCGNDNLVSLCHCICRIAAKSVQVYMSKFSHAHSHQSFKGGGIEQLRSIFGNVLTVSERLHSSSWSILSALVSCISDIARACAMNSSIVAEVRNATPKKLVILLRAKEAKSSVSFQNQKLIYLDARSEEHAQIHLWSLIRQ